MAVLTHPHVTATGLPSLSNWSGGVYYPSSDGRPMADNGNQAHWITLVAGELRALFPAHYVAEDRLWYPVEGRPDLVKAPDVMVVLGRPADRPPHARPSYRQWLDAHVAPTAVFEFVSESNTPAELFEEKRTFYERHGVGEYIVYDPRPDGASRFALRAWQRRGDRLEEVALPAAGGWRSPLLGITFAREGDVPEGELRLVRPDGQPFRTFSEVSGEAARERVEKERERARADRERARADAAEAKFAQLRALGIDPDTL